MHNWPQVITRFAQYTSVYVSRLDMHFSAPHADFLGTGRLNDKTRSRDFREESLISNRKTREEVAGKGSLVYKYANSHNTINNGSDFHEGKAKLKAVAANTNNIINSSLHKTKNGNLSPKQILRTAVLEKVRSLSVMRAQSTHSLGYDPFAARYLERRPWTFGCWIPDEEMNFLGGINSALGFCSRSSANVYLTGALSMLIWLRSGLPLY
jgi:hypothetical protein